MVELLTEKHPSRHAGHSAVLLGGGLLFLGFVFASIRSARSARRSPGRARSLRDAAQPRDAEADGEVSATRPLEERDRKRLLRGSRQTLEDETKAQKRRATSAAERGPVGRGVRSLFHGARKLLERAAEVRHDQNRFEEAAELLRARPSRWEAAGAIYAADRALRRSRAVLQSRRRQASRWPARCSSAQRTIREAGKCYREIGFHRQAAQAFLKAGSELEAAPSPDRCLRRRGRGQGRTRTRARPARDARASRRRPGELL